MGAEMDPRLVGGGAMRSAKVTQSQRDETRESPGSVAKSFTTEDEMSGDERQRFDSSPQSYCAGHPLEGLLRLRHPSVVDIEPKSLGDLTDAERATNTDLFFAIQQGALMGGARDDLHDCRHGSFAQLWVDLHKKYGASNARQKFDVLKKLLMLAWTDQPVAEFRRGVTDAARDFLRTKLSMEDIVKFAIIQSLPDKI